MAKKDKYGDKKKKAEPVEVKQNESAQPLAQPSTSATQVARPISFEGTKGKPTPVAVNYFKMKVDTLVTEAFHYHLEFNPPGPRKFISQALELFRTRFFQDEIFAFDGRCNVYTKNKLTVDILEKKVDLNTDQRVIPYTIKIQFTKSVDLSILKEYKNAARGENFSEALQCVDIILKCRFKNTNAQAFKRQFYFPPASGRIISLNPGMELWRGLYQSTVMGKKSLYLNADVLNKAVPSEMTVLNYLSALNRGRIPSTLERFVCEEAAEHLKGLKVVYKVKPDDKERFKVVNQFGRSSRTQQFTINNQTMTVEQYFKTKFQIKLQFPLLPTIHVLPIDKNIFLPMEFCRIPGGQLNQKKCTDKCLQRMIKETATSTERRKELIREITQNYALNADVKNFGIEVDVKFEEVMARIINAPQINYAGNRTEVPNPKNGKWRDGPLIAPSQIDVSFAIICCENISVQVLQSLKKDINNTARANNMQLHDTQGADNIFMGNSSIIQSADNMKNFLGDRLDRCRQLGFGLVIVIVSDKHFCYSLVKKIAETEVGILTQCLKPRCFYNARDQAYNMNFSTKTNIFLKLNAKLDGTNHRVNEPSYNATIAVPVMFVGADVTHPTADQRGTEPSIAAVCASFDRCGLKYNAAWRLQKGGLDRIDEFESIMLEQFAFFKRKNNFLPSKIIYYRDGVGDSQFVGFLGPETDSLKRACQKVYPANKLPEITVVVVNKRHHMRAFPVSKESGDGTDFNNILPGTVVDKDIVHNELFQFFLASHSAIQGCSRPAKYTVLLNECRISPDDMQALTHCLCHMYVRCNRSVSYPACTYYAHWMAFRAKHYISGSVVDLDNLAEEYQTLQLKQEVVAVHPMFFV